MVPIDAPYPYKSPFVSEPEDPAPRTRQVLDPVVAVRLPRATLARLDRLCEATGRNRAVYLRAAINRMLPVLELRYGDDVLVRDREREVLDLDAAFGAIIANLTDNPEDNALDDEPDEDQQPRPPEHLF
jgi:predicted DNA-binding protein